jgi:hypothetical protein
MTPRRSIIIANYEPEIEALYQAVEETTQATAVLPENWTPESTHHFVQSVVRSVIKEKVPEDSDLFQHGCDRCGLQQLSTPLHGLTLTSRLQSASYVDPEFYFACSAEDDKT